MLRLSLTVFAFAAFRPLIAQDIDAGERSFRKCTPCHSIGPDAQNKLGPILNGLDGRKSGTIENYTYTEANKNSGIVWRRQDIQRLHHRSARENSEYQDDLSRASRTKKNAAICGPTSSSSTKTARLKNEFRGEAGITARLPRCEHAAIPAANQFAFRALVCQRREPAV